MAAQTSVSALRFNDSFKNSVEVMLSITLAILFCMAVSYFWAVHHHEILPPNWAFETLGPLVIFLPPLALFRRPRWELRPDGVYDLRSGHATPLARYNDIRYIGTLKSHSNSARTFAIVTRRRTFRVDVFQGEAFLNTLEQRIAAAHTDSLAQ